MFKGRISNEEFRPDSYRENYEVLEYPMSKSKYPMFKGRISNEEFRPDSYRENYKV